MKTKILILNSIGRSSSDEYIIHSPSRWSEKTKDSSRYFAYYPYYLGYLSSLLKRETHHHVMLLDGCMPLQSATEVEEKIFHFKPQFIFCELASLVYLDNLAILKNLKKKLPSLTLCLAGPHGSTQSKKCLEDGFNYIFVGNYLGSALSFFQNLPNLPRTSIIPASPYKFSDLPWPEDEDTPRINYASPGEPSSEFKEIQIYGSRGCLGACSFCVAHSLYYGHEKPEARPPENIIQEMTFLKSKYPELEGFFFDEEDHFVEPSMVKKLCHLLIDKGSPFKIECMGRLHLLEPSLLSLLKKAGYYKIRLGIESLNPEVQNFCCKPISKKHFYEVIDSAFDLGIKIYLTLQVGLPNSTQQIDRHSVDTCLTLLRMNKISNLQISLFTPFPGTHAFEVCKKNQWLTTKDLKEYNGGLLTVISYPHYTQDMIQQVYEESMILRNHVILKKNLNNLSDLIYFLIQKYQKLSLKNFIKKIFIRVYEEFRVIKLKRSNNG